MSYINLRIVAICLIISITSCKKEPCKPDSNKVCVLEQANSIISYRKFIKDSEGLLTQIEYYNTHDNKLIKVFKIGYNNEKQINWWENENNYDSITYKNDKIEKYYLIDVNNSKNNKMQTFEYNPNNQLIKVIVRDIKSYKNIGERRLTYSNGNVIKVEQTDSLNNISRIVHYKYNCKLRNPYKVIEFQAYQYSAIIYHQMCALSNNYCTEVSISDSETKYVTEVLESENSYPTSVIYKTFTNNILQNSSPKGTLSYNCD